MSQIGFNKYEANYMHVALNPLDELTLTVY